jgi:CBS-domain-containing membrane protein
VIDDEMRLAGNDYSAGYPESRKANQMNAPVKAYMTRNVIRADGNTTVRQIEKLFYQHDIGHLPIVETRRWSAWSPAGTTCASSTRTQSLRVLCCSQRRNSGSSRGESRFHTIW